MTQPLALQLYSVREEVEKDFEGTIRRVADMGYLGVETAGFPDGVTAADARQLFDELNLQVVAAHAPILNPDKQDDVLEQLNVLGTNNLVIPYIDPNYFTSVDGIKQACDIVNKTHTIAQAAGLNLIYHNHDFEYAVVEGRVGYEYMLEYLHPEITFEIDTYWVQTAGQDVIDILQKLLHRVTLLHIKDGPATVEGSMVAVGQGVMDVFRIIPAGAAAKWLIVELDRCDTDMMEAVASSAVFLTEARLARGR